MNLGTWLKTIFRGKLMGEDEYGNRYYQDRRLSRGEIHRRWVVYKGMTEATKVPPQWHAWLHYTSDTLPSNRKKYTWEKPHLRNLTGTPYAYKPKGWGREGILHHTTDYDPWKPH